jgi:3-oxoacyl-[acyl-carrier-protein] synthase I
MTPVAISALTATSCLGAGLRATYASLQTQRSGLAPCNFETVRLDTYIGQVGGVDAQRLPSKLENYNCRNNRLALLGLSQDGFIEAAAQAIARYGAHRVGLFLGTSTSGILEAEIAYRHRDPQTGLLPEGFKYAGSLDFFSVASFVRRLLGLEGPTAVVSTACSSSAKVFAMAKRYINLGLIDAALVGGVDSLCLTTLYGFHSLQLTSALPCRPFDAHRDGISIGEAAAFALLEAVSDSGNPGTLALLGVGESSDAYHISTPHPEGCGARHAMQGALGDAGLAPSAVDYINLHGTGTPSNDSAESKAVEAIFGTKIPCSSTKGASGHTLGAAGALEVAISALAITHGFMPAGLHCTKLDPACHLNYLRVNGASAPRVALSNSLGFGGTNCSVLLGRLA